MKNDAINIKNANYEPMGNTIKNLNIEPDILLSDAVTILEDLYE